MTTPAQLSVSVVPGSVQVSSPGEYQVVSLTLTVANVTSAPVDLSGGLTVSLPVDPGGGGSQAALVLTEASVGGADGTQPVVAITPGVATGVPWTIAADTASPGPCNYLVLPAGNGILPAGASVVLTFDDVVPDFTPGQAEITVSVLPASPGGNTITLTAAVVKTPAPLIATLSAVPSLLTVPDNTTRLSWQVLGAASCELTWDPPTTVVSYGSQQYEAGAWLSPPFQFGPGDPLPVATLIEDTEFTLTANGQGTEVTAEHVVTLGKPLLYALTIPPVTDVAASAGGSLAPTGIPLITSVIQEGAGDPLGGQQVTVSGSGFTGTATVSFGMASTTGFTVVSDSQLTVTAPPAAAADIDADALGTNVGVTVTLAGGASSPATQDGQYTYANLVRSVLPGQPFLLTWSCFDGASPLLEWGPGPQVPDTMTDTVTMAVTAGANEITKVTVLPSSGSAVVTVTTPTIFSLQTTPYPAPAPLFVDVAVAAVTSFTASAPAVNPVDGSQSVTLAWTTQNATGITITGGAQALTPAVGDTSAVAVLPPPPAPPGPVTFRLTLTAAGYASPGAENTGTVTVTPVPVTLTAFSPASAVINRGQSVTLSWNAIAATGFSLVGVEFPEAATEHAAANALGPGVHTATVAPAGNATYQLAALGYPRGAMLPFATARISVTKPPKEKEKEKERKERKEGKEALIEKRLPDNPVLPRAAGGREDDDPGLPPGTERTFIDPDERPGLP